MPLFNVSVTFMGFENRREVGLKKNVLKVEVLLLVYLNEVCQYMCYITFLKKKNKIGPLCQLR